METYLKSNKKDQCCGCRACEQICPRQCIRMIRIEGFLYPQINRNMCINCKLCEKVCQLNQKKELKYKGEQTTFAAWNTKKIEVENSTSGGIFPALSNQILEEEGIIYGAVLDINAREVFLKKAETTKHRELMRKSKYVWSDTKRTYSEIQKELENGKKVLFSGTPCQVAGLRSFLQKDYNDLFCIDIICHGMPANIVFTEYVEYLEKKYNSKIKAFEFRHKKEGIMKSCYHIEFENDFILEEELGKNSYSLTYNSLIAHMPMCNKCPYASKDRVSDITIGDFWGIEKIDSKNTNGTGTSLVIVNTLKGKQLWEKASQKVYSYKESIDMAAKYNPAICYPIKRHPWRKQFLNCLKHNGFEKAFILYIKIGNKLMVIYRAIRKINEIISRKLRS